MLKAEKPRESREKNSKNLCSPSLFRLEMDHQLNRSSIFHHHYQALWQRDLSVLTITVLKKFAVCSHMEKI